MRSTQPSPRSKCDPFASRDTDASARTQSKGGHRHEPSLGICSVLRSYFAGIFFFSVILGLLTHAIPLLGQSSPVRYQAQYTQLYSENVETLAPTVGPDFALGAAGSITSNPSEVISGSYSIKGSYFGTGSFTSYLQSVPANLPLSPNQTYQVTFKYRILTTPSQGFEVLFFSPTAAASGNFLPSFTITGSAGATGTATLTNTLGPYSDYQVRWDVEGTGAISIDDIQVISMASGQVIASLNAEQQAPTVGAGLQLSNGASVTTDPSLVIAGNGSILLTDFGTMSTNPASLSLSGNTSYIVQFQYHIINPGSSANVLFLWMQPTGTTDNSLQVSMGEPLNNAATAGTFSAGAETASAASYQLNVSATSDSTVVIDNISVFRKDVVQSASLPPSYSALDQLPFPRLGKDMLGAPVSDSQFPTAEPPFTYSVDQIEHGLAFNDIIFGLDVLNQTAYPDSIRRIRQLNPNAVILPYRISEEQPVNIPPPLLSNLSPNYDFLQGIADGWYVRDIEGNYVPDPQYPFSRPMNLSPFSPVVNGQTFLTYETDWLTGTVFPSGLWDGVFFDNLFGQINPHILNANNPALLDYDWNRNGIRDETPASSSDMTRTAATSFLQDLQTKTGGLQLIVGNNGPFPELPLATFVNGYLFECVNYNWNSPFLTGLSPGGWRDLFDAYRIMQTSVRTPRINVLEGCGQQYLISPGPSYTTPTASDIQAERFTMGTALLSDGFYSYDLHGSLSAPLWFDEYSVDSSGAAVEDPTNKGYLGQALSDATELTSPGSLIFQEGFETGTLPASFIGNPASAVSVSQTPANVIDGGGSLVISNPDHAQQGYVSANTNPNVIQFAPSTTYLLAFDWRILQTLDSVFEVDVFNGTPSLDFYNVPGVVTGDSGTAYFPFTIPATGSWTIRFAITNGGGEVAIDNVRIYQGGVGPWRRDFQNGFVLVNPFSQPHTFSAADLSGPFERTGIHRINGTQDPNTNNGQPVTGSLTLGAFDAIILLTDHIAAPPFADLSATNLTFANQMVGTTSGAQPVTLSNTGDAALTISSLQINGTNASDFAETNTCGTSIPAGANCVINVTFKPTVVGSRNATLTFMDNAAGSPQIVSLVGSGTAPAVSLSLATLTFGSQNLNTTSAAQSVTLTNSGTAALSVTSITASAQYSQSNTCGSSVAAGANCTISVTFTPTVAGTETGTITITDNAPGSPHAVSLSGTGMAADFFLGAASGSSTSATVTAGEVATYNLQVSTSSGFNGSVSLSCTGAPSQSSCATSPTSVTLSGAAPAAFTVTATTSTRSLVPTASIHDLWPHTRQWPATYKVLILLCVLGIGWVAIGHLPKAARVWAPAIILLACLGLLAACGGGGGGGTGGGGASGTPAGTYALTITGTSGGISHTMNLMLTVN